MPVVPERCPAQDGVVGEPGVQMDRPWDGHCSPPASGQVRSGIRPPPAASRTAACWSAAVSDAFNAPYLVCESCLMLGALHAHPCQHADRTGKPSGCLLLSFGLPHCLGIPRAGSTALVIKTSCCMCCHADMEPSCIDRLPPKQKWFSSGDVT